MSAGRTPDAAALERFLREHFPFYIAAIVLTFVVAALYLFDRHSGTNSALVGLPLDDNWIHLVYARSLAQQGWFNYNPGVSEAGMSSPLWVVLLALAYKVLTPLGISPQLCAKSLSLFCALGVPVLTYHVARPFFAHVYWAWLAGLLAVVEPNLAYGNVAGMEVPLFSVFTLAAVWLSQRRRYLLTGILLGLGVVTRAEATLDALVVGLILLAGSLVNRKTLLASKALTIGLQLFLPSLILGGAWALYNHSISGQWLPNTFFVKHDFALGYVNLENFRNVLAGYAGHLALFDGPALPLTLIMSAAAVWSIYRHKQVMVALPLLLIPLVQLYTFSINIRVVADAAPWTYFTRRYMDFLLPLWIVLLSIGVAFLWGLAAQAQHARVVLFGRLAIVAMLLVIGWTFIRLHAYLMEQYSWNTANVEQVDVAMGQWIAGNLPPHATIGVTDSGAMRFWSRHDQQIVDFLGLNCWRCVGRPIPELLGEFRPDDVVVFRPALNGAFAFRELYSIQVEHNTILGGNELVAVEIRR